jgi:hypothetical protein
VEKRRDMAYFDARNARVPGEVRVRLLMSGKNVTRAASLASRMFFPNLFVWKCPSQTTREELPEEVLVQLADA